MCGICGIISPSKNLEPKIRSMVVAQSHRGPDANDTHISECGTCALGHNRLSIIDLSDIATQPMVDYTGRYWIVFNGEVYNYRELRAQLSDYPYRTNSDTEVILAAWHAWGEDCVSYFIGMFSFAIWDDKEKKLTAFRDRIGIKPFHYSFDGRDFIFSSEIKSILAAGVEARPDMEIWAEYLNYGLFDHTSSTFFKDVLSLDPGHKLEFKNGKLSITPFWALENYLHDKFTGTFEQAQERYFDLFEDSVRLRLRSDVPLGVNVSGGLDSASLMAMVDRTSDNDSLKAFTVSFKGSSYDEENFAAAIPVKKHWDRYYTEMNADELWKSIGQLMYHQEAPYGGIGTLSYARLFKDIDREKVTVVLEGQGVDETLGGYAYYQRPANDSGGTYQDGTSFLHPECISAPIKEIPKKEIIQKLNGASPLSRALYNDVRHNKIPRVLRMNDRLSMAVGKELREPYLDHRLVEFCFSLPDDFKIRNGQGKYLLRNTMRRLLPSTILDTDKRPVVTPQREWMKDYLRAPVEALLDSGELEALGMFNIDESRKAFADYCNGIGNNGFFIWQWINAASWAKTFNVRF